MCGHSTLPPDNEERLLYQSDWLASRPCFYNLRNGRAGQCINDVIDPADLEFDPEGLNDYLDFGFCVFEHTPVKDVRLLRHSARLWAGPDGLRVEQLDDPTYEWFDGVSTVDEVVELAVAVVNERKLPNARSCSPPSCTYRRGPA